MVANPAKFQLKCIRKLFCKHKCLMVRKYTAQKMKLSITVFFSKCDQIYRQLRIWSHLMKKAVKENFIFCAVVPFTDIIKISTQKSSGQIYFYAIEKLYLRADQTRKKNGCAIPNSTFDLETTKHIHFCSLLLK